MIVDAAANGAIAIALPKHFWFTRIVTGTIGSAIQLAGLYAAVVTFGAWITLALYSAGGLAIVLQIVLSRSSTCSRGD